MIKNFISKLLVLGMCFSLVPTSTTFAETIDGSSVTTQTTGAAVSITTKSQASSESDFTIDSSGKITKYLGEGGDIIVPEEINGIKATDIGSFVFARYRTISSITLPDTVTNIEPSACTYGSFSKITFSNNLKNIGDGAFYNCQYLRSITIPNSVASIGDGAFYYCPDLSSVIIPDSVTSIGTDAFGGCPNAVFRVESEGVKELLINSGVNESKIALPNQPLPVCITNLSLNTTRLDLKKGNTSTLTATISPNNATNKKLTWISSDTNVATVDENGKVTALGVGSANIICNTNDGSGISLVCLVNVTDTIVNPIVRISSIKLSVLHGGDQTFTLAPTIYPSNASNKELVWKSSNTKVATVDSNGNVTYVGKGNATIICYAKDGGGAYRTMFVQNDYYGS